MPEGTWFCPLHAVKVAKSVGAGCVSLESGAGPAAVIGGEITLSIPGVAEKVETLAACEGSDVDQIDVPACVGALLSCEDGQAVCIHAFPEEGIAD